MATKYKTRAFVFKKDDRNESDKLFSVFTDEFGRLDIFAKAIRKTTSKLRSGIDVFFLSEVEFIQGKNKKTLTDAVVIERFSNIYSSMERFSVANNIAEVLENFINGEEKDRELFVLLNDVFSSLNDDNFETKRCLKIYYYFLWNTLSLLGYRPEVERCNDCRGELDPDGVYFSNKSGGVICENCLSKNAESQKINADIIKILRLVFRRDWQTIYRLKIDELSQKMFKNISENYYSYILSSHSYRNSFDQIKCK